MRVSKFVGEDDGGYLTSLIDSAYQHNKNLPQFESAGEYVTKNIQWRINSMVGQMRFSENNN